MKCFGMGQVGDFCQEARFRCHPPTLHGIVSNRETYRLDTQLSSIWILLAMIKRNYSRHFPLFGRSPFSPYEFDFIFESQLNNVGMAFFDEMKHRNHIVFRGIINIPYVYRIPAAKCGCVVPFQ